MSVKKVGWEVSKPNLAASHTARLRSGRSWRRCRPREPWKMEDGRGVDCFVRVGVRRDIV